MVYGIMNGQMIGRLISQGDKMAQLRYPTNNYYRKIEATIRKDFAQLPDNHGVGYGSTMFKMAGERHTFDTHGGGSQYSYRGIDCDWFWDIAWLEDVVVLEESSNEEEEEE